MNLKLRSKYIKKLVALSALQKEVHEMERQLNLSESPFQVGDTIRFWGMDEWRTGKVMDVLRSTWNNNGQLAAGNFRYEVLPLLKRPKPDGSRVGKVIIVYEYQHPRKA